MQHHIYNFNSGPAMLPQIVLQQAAEAISHYQAGQSIVEISHRSNIYDELLNEVKSHLKELCKLNDDFEILILNGGASNLFAMIPMNFLSNEKSMAFVHTGYWSEKAISEAKKIGHVKIIASAESENFNKIPGIDTNKIDADFLHITTNNTIEGTQWKYFPDLNLPVFADMSSDILSRKINYNQFDLVYASTHKNLGVAGCTVVFVKRKLLEQINENTPNIFSFKKHAEANSVYSTPDVFGVFMLLLMLRWTKEQTTEKIFLANQQKAQILYKSIDDNELFSTSVLATHRSDVNVVFQMKDKTTEQVFLNQAADNGFINLAGHRSAGGFRASIYNAMPLQGVEQLATFIKNFK